MRSVFVKFWILCTAASFLGLPHLLLSLPNVSWEVLVLFNTALSSIIAAFACYVGYKVLPKTDLHPFVYLPLMRRTILPSVIGAVVVGGLMVLLDHFVLHASLSAKGVFPAWIEILNGCDRAVNGAAFLRLCVFTWLYSLMRRWEFPRLAKLWTANIAVALPFAAFFLLNSLHLEFSIHDAVVRTIILNGAPNLIFGSFYWSRGIWAVIGASTLETVIIQVANHWWLA